MDFFTLVYENDEVVVAAFECSPPKCSALGLVFAARSHRAVETVLLSRVEIAAVCVFAILLLLRYSKLFCTCTFCFANKRKTMMTPSIVPPKRSH